jgi:hypothetical protein
MHPWIGGLPLKEVLQGAWFVASEGLDAVAEDGEVALADGTAAAGERLERPRVGRVGSDMVRWRS